MKKLMIPAICAALVTGSAFAQEPNEHLSAFGPFIGSWRYEGPVLEKGPLAEVAGKSTTMVFEISLRWILDKQAVMSDWSIEFEDGAKVSGRLLTGWNAAERKIMGGGMDSMGVMGITNYVFDSAATQFTETARGVDNQGKEWWVKNVITKTGSDEIAWQRVEGSIGSAEGASPVYALKRVMRTRGKKAAN